MEFWFYQTEGLSSDNLLNLLYKSLNKVYENTKKCLVVCESEVLSSLDQSLWTKKKISFLPHARLSEIDQEPVLSQSPILLHDSLNAMPDRDYLFILQPYIIENFENLLLFNTKRICFLFNQNQNHSKHYRQVWQEATKRDIKTKFIKRKDNQWISV